MFDLLFFTFFISFFIFVPFLVIKYFFLSRRLKRCETLLHKVLAQQPNNIHKEILKKKVIQETLSPPPISPDEEIIINKKPKNRLVEKIITSKLVQIKPWKIPDIIKENWMGLFGSMALLIGTVFFGLTADIMQQPEVRVGIMMVGSFLLIAIGVKIENKKQWVALSGWLKSIAGAVILFATLGAGGIDGLQFIDSTIYALAFLCFGISLNILLAVRTPSQSVASFHVILSILALCTVPQATILLPLGAVIACTGLLVSYRSRWDMHLLLIVFAWTVQNTVWTFSLGEELSVWMSYLAIGCSLIVGIVAGLTHYSKKYKSPKFEVLPFIAHVANWGFLTWNIWIHFHHLEWAFVLLLSLSITGFVLARIAKKKEILWLYHTDTIVAQLIATASIVSLKEFSVSYLDLSLLVLMQVLLFNFICQIQKEKIISRFGLGLQACYLPIILTLLLKNFYDHSSFPYLKAGFVTATIWSYHLIAVRKQFWIDDVRFVVMGEKRVNNPLSIMTAFGSIFFICAYYFGIDSPTVQLTVGATLIAVALWRNAKEDASWNSVLIISLSLVHLIQWFIMAKAIKGDFPLPIFSKIDFLGLLVLDVFLIFGNFLQMKIWNRNLHQYVTYAMALQVGLLTYVSTQGISYLIPGPIFLGYSLIALEMSSLVYKRSRYSESIKHDISQSSVHVGIVFLLAFISRFVTVNLQIDPVWNGVSLRIATEILGILTIAYWLAFYPREIKKCKIIRLVDNYLVEGFLFFLTLSVFVEVQDIWRPFIWICMAIVMMLSTLNRSWPSRLIMYSWCYFIASILHVAFVTSALNMPNLTVVEKYHFPAILAIAMQLCYSVVVQKNQEIIIKRFSPSNHRMAKYRTYIFQQPSLTVILPVFLGIALLFAYNFQKTILTVLWVGLLSLYLGIGLFLKCKRSIQIAMAALVICASRLVIFDLVQSDLAVRALVFIGVGILMLGISVLYKKFKYRIESHEQI